MLYQRHVPGDVDAGKTEHPKIFESVEGDKDTSLLSSWADGGEEKSGGDLSLGLGINYSVI